MIYMICPSCHTKLNKDWNYCPKCGFMVEKNTSLFDYLNQQLRHLTKMMQDENIDIEDMMLPKDITIKIHTNFGKHNFEMSKPKRQPINKEPKKLPKNTIEPETIVKRKRNMIMINVELPGVVSDDDVDISIFANSVEIRATAGDRGYFKIISVPANFTLVDKQLEGEKLKLLFSRY